MEITSQRTPGYTLPGDVTATAKVDAPTPVKADASSVAKPAEAGLEVLQEAMRSLPDVDMDRVMAARQALLRGDIDAGDTAALASSILNYHRGSEV